MLRSAVFLAAVILVSSESPHSCAPEKWSAVMLGKVGQVVKGETQVLTVVGRNFIDHEKRMEAFIQNLTLNDGSVLHLRTVTNLNNNKTYSINLKTKTCEVRDVPNPEAYRRFCIGDPDLKLIDSLNVGGQMADIYELAFHNVTAITTASRGSYEPISSVIEQVYFGLPQLIAFQYGNISEGEAPFPVFELPSYCPDRPKPRRVCAPPQWEAIAFGKLGQMVGGKPMTMTFQMEQSRDFTNKREVTATRTVFDGKTYSTKDIMDWNSKTRYRITEDGKKCEKHAIATGKMLEFCRGEDGFTWLHSLRVNGRDADVYRTQLSAYNVTSTITAFRDNFTPISIMNEQVINKIPQLVVTQYGNITTGIADESVFKLPTSCTTKTGGIFG